MKKIISITIVSALFLSGFTIFVPKKKKQEFVVAFYNVENLFDTIDDPLTDDSEFLPTAESKWNTEKYTIKLNNLAKVISSLKENSFPDVIGLCEIENRSVLESLTKTELLKNAGYEIIHSNSPDARGIDVAALYRKEKFTLITSRYLPVKFEKNPDEKTRDILYIKGIACKKDTLHLYFNHWPSRRSGQEESEHKRVTAAMTLRKHADSIQSKDVCAKIIIAGDMNDHPNDRSLFEIINALKYTEKQHARFFNLFYEEHEDSLGTHYFKGEWGVLDNIIVSGNLLSDAKGIHCKEEDAKIFKPDWILYTDKSGKKTGPAKSYVGKNFHSDGYSDHLPVILTLTSFMQ